MLYDKRWDKPEIKTAVYSLEGLIAWLEMMPRRREYDFCSADSCLVAQYLIARGVKHYDLWSREVAAHGWLEIVNPREGGEQTFGAALDRARKALAER